MDGHIGQLHCRYRVLHRSDTAPGLAMHLERVARERLVESYAQALEQALGDDQVVYVVRQVRASLALRLNSDTSDAAIAQRWGEHLAGAVVRAIAAQETGFGRLAGGNGAGVEVIRFADQPDYVAHFVIDLLNGVAWEQWFYGAFSSWRAAARQEALSGVLLDYAGHLPAILAYLRRYGALEGVLAALDSLARRRLWAELREEPAWQAATWQALFAVVMRLGDRLKLWAVSAPGPDALATFLASRPVPPDWRDRAGLAQAIVTLFRFLAARGYLCRWDSDLPDQQPDGLEALDDLDWLDLAQLQAGLQEVLRGSPELSPQSRANLPTRSAAHGPTPRQRELLNALLTLLTRSSLALDQAQPDSAANALRFYAALIEQQPGWAGDPLVSELIHRLLAAWAWLTRLSVSAAELAAALRALPQEEGGQARASLDFLTSLGQPGLAVMTALIQNSQTGPALLHSNVKTQAGRTETMPLGEEVETECAGVALLLRVLLDSRFAALLDRLNFPPAELSGPARRQTMLLPLFLRWAGEHSHQDGQIDGGLTILSGLGSALPVEEAVDTVAALRDRWASVSPGDQAGYQAAWLRLLYNQRLLSGEMMCLELVKLAGDTPALVAGDETATVWPWGQVLAEPAEVSAVLAGWHAAWTEALGSPPGRISVADSLRPYLASSALAVTGEAETETGADGRERLQAALLALDAGRLGLPQADLSLALTALGLLRLWARWLRNFSESSIPYLLRQFIRRPGWIRVTPEQIVVILPRRPLDMVLEMAGYLADLNQVIWLGGTSVHFQLRG